MDPGNEISGTESTTPTAAAALALTSVLHSIRAIDAAATASAARPGMRAQTHVPDQLEPAAHGRRWSSVSTRFDQALAGGPLAPSASKSAVDRRTPPPRIILIPPFR